MSTVTVTDTGPNLLLSGPTEDAVLAEVMERERIGYRRNAAPQRLGAKWVVTIAKPGDPGKTAADCQIERLGQTVVVRGPTESAVREKVGNLVTGGAKLLDEIACNAGEWSAILDAPR